MSEWARALIGKMILHRAGAIGKVKAFYDGVETQHISPINQRPVTGPVLELDNGHTFMARNDERPLFIELDEHALVWIGLLRTAFPDFLRKSLEYARATRVDVGTAKAIVIILLEEQVRALRADHG